MKIKRIIVLSFVVFALAFSCFASDFDGYIVKIADNTASRLASSANVFSESASLLSELEDDEVADLLSEELCDVQTVNSEHLILKVADENSLNELIELGVVESYEKDTYLELLGYEPSSNPDYADQQWYLDAINAHFAWNAGIFGKDVIVGVVDSGVYAHDDIKNNIIDGKNYCDVATLGEDYTTDNSNHGTHVAGIIASGCNSLATVGISFRSKVVPLKVTNSSKLLTSNAVTAIYDAVDYYNCSVINLSFGDTSVSDNLYNAIKYAIDKNVIVVAASGNAQTDTYYYPASHSEVVSVGNAQRTDDGLSLSIRYSSQNNDMVDIAAPGTAIISIDNTGSVSSVTGTSFACPVISSVAALAKSIKPELSQSEFEQLIKASADSSYILYETERPLAWGAGLVDIESFFSLLLSDTELYVSENITINNEALVYLTNLNTTETLEKCSVIISEYTTDGSLINTECLSLSFSPMESKEISLTSLGFSENAVIRVFTDYMPGDVNGDGSVNIRDATAILRYIAGLDVSVVAAALDVNGDGNLNIRDASLILRHCAGYTVEFH